MTAFKQFCANVSKSKILHTVFAFSNAALMIVWGVLVMVLHHNLGHFILILPVLSLTVLIIGNVLNKNYHRIFLDLLIIVSPIYIFGRATRGTDIGRDEQFSKFYSIILLVVFIAYAIDLKLGNR